MTLLDGRPDPAAEHRAQLRAVARRLHPDLGGDPDAYLAAVAALDEPRGPASPAPAGRTTTSGPVGHVHRARRRIRRGLRTAGRTARTRLPRSLPGSRRYAQL